MTNAIFKMVGVAGAVTLLALPAGAQNPSCSATVGNLVQNCSFENPGTPTVGPAFQFTNSITGWTSSTGQFERWFGGFNSFVSREGNAHLELDVDAANQQGNTTIRQSVATAIGARYDVFFSVGHRSLASQISLIGLMLNGSNVFTAGPLTDVNPGQYVWVDYQHSFVASTLITEIGFAAFGPSNEFGDHLDNIGMTLSPQGSVVPEPASLALMAAGLAGMFGVARRRKGITA